jgi:phage recombination protein Bet
MEFSKEQLALIKKTCIPRAANQEHIDQFLYVAEKYGLDPLTKEIVLDIRVNSKTGEKRPVIITTRDGYLKAAMGCANYNDINSGVIREGDLVEYDPIAGHFRHCFGEKRGKILSAWAVAKAKDRDPIICLADYDEYARANSASHTWRNYPTAMIQKVAEIMALKRQFSITGLVGEEEISSGLLDNGAPETKPAGKSDKTPQAPANTNKPAEKTDNPKASAEKPVEPTKPVDKNPAKPVENPAEKPAESVESKPTDNTPPEPAEYINIVVMNQPISQTEAEVVIRGIVFLDEPQELNLVVPAGYSELLVDGKALLATGTVEGDKFVVTSMKGLEEAEVQEELSGEFIKLLDTPKGGAFSHKGEKIVAPWTYVEYQGKENIFAVGKALAGFNKGDTLAVNISDSITKNGKVMLFIESASRLEQAVR